MRVSILLLAFVALVSCLSLTAASSGTWGVFADGGCSISLYSASFVNGACGAQSSGSTTIYYITTCDDSGNWTEQEYADAACTTKSPNAFMKGASGSCFANGQYFGQVVCPSSSKKLAAAVPAMSIVDLLPVGPVSAASTTSVSLMVLALAAIMALFA